MFRIILLVMVVIMICLTAACASVEPSYQAFVWEDVNGDGDQGPDEEALAGITVQIVDQSNGLLWKRPKTDDQGYTFPFTAGDTCGQYGIQLVVPEDYWPSTPVIAYPQNCEIVEFGLNPYP